MPVKKKRNLLIIVTSVHRADWKAVGSIGHLDVKRSSSFMFLQMQNALLTLFYFANVIYF